MAGQDPETPPSDRPAVHVPQLIEQYRVQREAWMAQADELARLRDEVRGSAEHEAMEIVTSARRDIRRIVMEARRELFVLSAQVQAALGEAPPPRIPSARVANEDDRRTIDEELEAFAQEEWGFAPRSSVAAVLEEARADMAILDQDARVVPAPRAADTAGVGEHPSEAELPPATDSDAAPVPPAAPMLSVTGTETPSTLRRLAIPFAVAALVFVIAAVWMLRPSGTSEESADSNGAPQPQASAPAASAAAASGSAGPAPEAAEEPDAVRLSIEAVRPAWIRAVVDGRGDPSGRMLRAGETYEFTGRSIALRVGDAGAVRVSVNGGEARTLGGDGQVVNREFTLDLPDPSGESRAPAGETTVPQEPPPASGQTTAAGPPLHAPADAPAALPSPPDPAAFAAGGPPRVSATSGEGALPAPAPSIERTASVTGGGAGEPDRSALIEAAERWLDAYQRQDQVALSVLSTPGVMIADERPTAERVPVTAGAIARTLDRVTIRSAADTAILTGVMTERAMNGGLQRSSPVSLVWVSNNGEWRLSQARLVAPSTLGQFLR